MSDVKTVNGVPVDLDDPNANRQHPEPNVFTAFKEGERVRFKGLQVGDIILKPYVGLLKFVRNVNVTGAVSIEGEPKKLIFNSDGSLYCHSQYGILLERVKECPVVQKGK